jgi:hypothetical protein
MIDYRSHLVALTRFESYLRVAEEISEPAVAADRDHQLRDVEQERGLAALGSLIDHLLRHAASDGQELALLERAASLWKEGVALYTSLGDSRSNIESALLDPANPNSVGRFNDAIENIRLLALGLNTSSKVDELDALRQDVMKLSHIPEHPRQVDLQLPGWGWGDVFLARRTDAFVRTVYRRAQDPALRSFAFGVLSSYSANLFGSAYLEQVVGGPRRSHRFRDRVASNVVGSWFAQTNPEVRSLASIADLIRFGADPAAPALPAPVESLIRNSLQETYDLNRTAPLPDLQTGYSRLVRHLELLDTFHLPPPPTEPMAPFLVRIYGDPSNPPTPLLTVQASNFASGPGQGPGGSPTNYSGSGKPTTTDSAPTTGERCGSFWLGIIYAVMFLGGGFAPCIGAWAQGNRCTLWDAIWEQFGNANRPSQEQLEALASQSQQLTAAEFPAAAGVDQMTKMVGYMFDMQSHLWEALGKAQAFLAIHGMIYPDAMLHQPVYKQFLTVPTAVVTLPLRPEEEPVHDFYRYPPTEVENPPYGWGPYPIGATPNTFIDPSPQEEAAPTPAASEEAVKIWSQIARGGDFDASNYDLDADRGFGFPCWSTQGSINSDPVGVQILSYANI